MEINLQEITQNIEETASNELNGKYLTFWTDQQLMGVPIAHVVQIVGMQEITGVPEFPYYAKGIINLRGTIIPVIDARLRLGKIEIPYNERTCIIVTNISERPIGVIVDEVDAVMTIEDSLISPPPHLTDARDSYIVGIGKLPDRVVLLMDICKILGSDELHSFTEAEVS